MIEVKKIFLIFLAIPVLIFNLSGCVPLVVGGAVGAVGGYAASKDTIQGDSDSPYESLWNAAVRVAEIRGKIRREDANTGIIQADIESSLVWIRLVRLTRATTRIRVSARKYHFPNLALAQDLYVKIIEQAK
ncbi:MAG: DUF3568 family protein [Candidatus Omnitrophota bacterium]|jgi:hypothetical protein